MYEKIEQGKHIKKINNIELEPKEMTKDLGKDKNANEKKKKTK